MGFIMYSAHTLQVNHLIKNIVPSIERDNRETTKTAIQSEVDFHKKEDRKSFYKRYGEYDKPHSTSHNHRKVPTIYCGAKYRNLLDIHILRAFSSYPIKYI